MFHMVLPQQGSTGGVGEGLYNSSEIRDDHGLLRLAETARQVATARLCIFSILVVRLAQKRSPRQQQVTPSGESVGNVLSGSESKSFGGSLNHSQARDRRLEGIRCGLFLPFYPGYYLGTFATGSYAGSVVSDMPTSELVITTEPTPGEVQYLEDRIYEFNASATNITDGEWLAILVRDGEDRIVAGICGNTWGGCLEIRQFWVEEARRKQGLGTRLLGAAEQEARRRGCRQILLMTFSFQAPAFYVKHGFEVVSVVDNHPRGHKNLLLRKRLGKSSYPRSGPDRWLALARRGRSPRALSL